MAKNILLIPHNHFDPIWRRCFDRPARYNGTVVRSYVEIEEHVIRAWLRLADRGYPFSEGQVAVWRKFLERNPTAKARLQAEIKAGRLDVLLAGETVQDTVLPAAEGLVRNFLVAQPFYRELIGESHPSLKLASAEDAFGNSPNYPQILRGVGAEAVCWLTYRTLDEDVWVGIDGSKVMNADRHPELFVGAFAKHAPCPVCRGKGCAVCRKSGLLFADGYNIPLLRKTLLDAAGRKEPWVVVRLLTEEFRSDPRLVELVDAMNRKLRGRSRIRFANPMDVYRLARPRLLASLKQRDDRPSADLNPAAPGCMVSRTALKQRTRAVTYRLIAAEATLANAAWKAGKAARPPVALARAWQEVVFNQFHDAITGTHIDSANRELHAMLDRAETVAQRYRPLDNARPGAGKLKLIRTPRATIRLGRMTVRFDRCGILSILCNGRDLFRVTQPKWNSNHRDFRIGELALEHDFGDPWGRHIAPPGSYSWDDWSCVALGDYHTAVQASDRAIRWTGRYTAGDPKVKKLNWTITATASADGRRLEFVTNVDWDTGSRRLRVLVPVASTEATATYEVPFGFIERPFDPAPLGSGARVTPPMEFPALHWVRKSINRKSGVALLNKGLPCYRWQPTRLDLSLVRSPEYSSCLVEPASYEFWDLDGMRDAGRHTFEYALLPYTDGLSLGDLTRIGYAYNMPAPIRLPFDVAGDVVVTAWKPAEDGSGWILRLQEAGGKGTRVRLTFDQPCEVVMTNLLEAPQGPARRTTRFRTPLHRHGILTLRIRR